MARITKQPGFQQAEIASTAPSFRRRKALGDLKNCAAGETNTCWRWKALKQGLVNVPFWGFWASLSGIC